MVPLAPELIVLKEYFNLLLSSDLSRTTGRFFLNSQDAEMLVSPLKDNFTKTNNTYTIFKKATLGAVPLYRYFHLTSKYHFYLPGVLNKAAPVLPGFSFDGEIGSVYPVNASNNCPTGSSPVYRFRYNSSVAGEARHRFTADPIIKSRLLATTGWIDEKVGFCANSVNVEPTPVEPPVKEAMQGYSNPNYWKDAPLLNRIFFTRLPADITAITAAGWRKEDGTQAYSNFNRVFNVYPTGPIQGTVALYRYYSTTSVSHVYSTMPPSALPSLQSDGIVGYTRDLIAGKCPENSIEFRNIFLPNGTATDSKPRNVYWTKDQVSTYNSQYTATNGRDDGIAFCAFK